ncbi:hypothetical protein B0H14DRAFT_2602829 [Mycena olivaceomarginata]|nr:hypothetical protein B0H14DRAFT_2602829 [Mycena olivaceomarginata]
MSARPRSVLKLTQKACALNHQVLHQSWLVTSDLNKPDGMAPPSSITETRKQFYDTAPFWMKTQVCIHAPLTFARQSHIRRCICRRNPPISYYTPTFVERPESPVIVPACPNGPHRDSSGARDCSWKRCKTCCKRQGKGCKYSGHRRQSNVTASTPSLSGDPSQLSRPAPMFAYDSSLHTSTPISTSDSASTAVSTSDSAPASTARAPKVYKKPMDPDWAKRYNANHEEREKRKAAEAQRRKQELLFERQVRVCCWKEWEAVIIFLADDEPTVNRMELGMR